jgi:hypothetical protein
MRARKRASKTRARERQSRKVQERGMQKTQTRERQAREMRARELCQKVSKRRANNMALLRNGQRIRAEESREQGQRRAEAGRGR